MDYSDSPWRLIKNLAFSLGHTVPEQSLSRLVWEQKGARGMGEVAPSPFLSHTAERKGPGVGEEPGVLLVARHFSRYPC